MKWSARAAVGVLTAGAMILAGCTAPEPATDAGEAPGTEGLAARVETFVTAWQAGRTHDAAALTTDPGAAALLLTTIAADLRMESLRISTEPPEAADDGSARVRARLSWDLPTAGQWTYDVDWSWQAPRGDEDWLLRYAPTVIHPDLGRQQTLAVRTVEAHPGTIVDRHDVELLRTERVYSVVVLLGAVGDEDDLISRLADILAASDSGIDETSIRDGIRRARDDGADSYTVVNLRAEEFAAVEAELSSLGAVALPSQLMSLTPTRGFAPTVISQLRPVAAELAGGEPGWQIVTVDAVGDELAVIAEQPATPGAKVTVTLDPQTQIAAQDVLASIEEPAVLVALQPSTGEILAVAQNLPADREGALALTGRYPPGSTFKIVTAAAAIEDGTGPTTTVNCPGEWTAEFSTIRNQGFARGRVSLTDAFAHSCNTTFAMLAADLAPAALPDTAAAFGIGPDFDITGIITLTGAIQAGETPTARAENGFGQGTDIVTPFSSALMAATVAAGHMPTPVLIRGTDTDIDRPIPELDLATVKGLRTLMRAVVTDGTARTLRDSGRVYAKTGTAEYVDGDGEISAHAWTVGYRDDIAFATLIVAGGSSGRTNEVIKDFLARLDAVDPAAAGESADGAAPDE